MSELLSQGWSFVHSKLWVVTNFAVWCGWCWNSNKGACGVVFGSFVPWRVNFGNLCLFQVVENLCLIIFDL